MSKPRVLLITARADTGGGPRHVLDLATGLADQADVFIASPEELPYAPEFRRRSADFFELPRRRFRLSRAWALARFCRRHGIQIVHSHGRGAGAYSRFLGLFGWKVVHSFHGFHPDSGWRSRGVVAVERILCCWTKAFVAVSPDEMDRTIRAGVAVRDRTQVIFNGLPANGAVRVPASSAADRSVFTFGALTRLEPHKGNHLLIDLVAKLPAVLQRQALFLIAGDGPERERLDSQIAGLGLSDIVRCVGRVENPASFLAGVDFFVSASQGEGLSYATLEALQAGRPLLLSRVAGHTELDGVPGVLFFDLNSPSEFGERVRELMAGQGPLPQLPARFQLSTMIRETVALYKRLLVD